MNPRFEITLRPDATSMVQRLGNRAGLGQAIARGMDEENELTLNVVRGKLSGEVLNRRTGRLRDSMQRTDAIVITDGTSIEVISTVGSNVRFGGESVRYAGIHEYGGRFQVPAHTRTVHFRDGTIASRKSFMRGVKSKAKKKPVVHRTTVYVRAYTIEFRARPYLRPTVYDRMPNYRHTISDKIVASYGGGA